MDNKDKREMLAFSNMCRSYLYMSGFLSDSENEKIHDKISKWQDKNRIAISRAQLNSVGFTYNDNAKEE